MQATCLLFRGDEFSFPNAGKLPYTLKKKVMSWIKCLETSSCSRLLNLSYLPKTETILFDTVISEKFWSPGEAGGLKEEREFSGKGVKLKCQLW